MKCQLLACCLLLTVAGCKPEPAPKPSPTAQPPQTIYPIGTPPNSRVTFESHTDNGEYHRKESANGTGTGIDATGDAAKVQQKTTAPNASLPGIGADGGASDASASALTLEGAASNPLLWVGIALLLGGGTCLYLGIRRAALICGVGGVGLIVAAMLPAWAWFIIAAVGLVAAGVYVWAEYHGQSAKLALTSVVRNVEKLPTPTRQAIKTNVASSAGRHVDRVTSMIRKIKDIENLPTERHDIPVIGDNGGGAA